VLVRPDAEHMDAGTVDLGSGAEPHVHHATDDLTAFLRGLRRESAR
jgi:hypothetical protein